MDLFRSCAAFRGRDQPLAVVSSGFYCRFTAANKTRIISARLSTGLKPAALTAVGWFGRLTLIDPKDASVKGLPSPAELLFPVLHSLCFGDQNSTAESRPSHPCERLIFVSQILLRRSRQETNCQRDIVQRRSTKEQEGPFRSKKINVAFGSHVVIVVHD
jgi:hypothetical protein